MTAGGPRQKIRIAAEEERKARLKRVRFIDQIARAEHPFQSLVELTADAIFCYEYDPPISASLPVNEQVSRLYEGVLVDCNDACAKTYGATGSDEVIGKNLSELFPKTDGSLDRLYRVFIEGGYQTIEGESAEVLPDGTKRFYLNNAVGIMEDDALVRIWGTWRDITERTEAHQALREAEARTRALLDANPDLVFRVDREGRYLDFHAGDRTRLAFSPEDFIGHKASEFFDSGFVLASQRCINSALDTGEMQLWEYQLSIEGVDRDFEARYVRSGKNEVVVTIRDITEKKHADEQLRLIQSRLNEAQRISKTGNWERNVATNEVWWSEEIYRLFELDPQECSPAYETFLERVHPDDRQRIERAMENILAGDGPLSIDYRIQLLNGPEKVMHSEAQIAAFGEEGQPARLAGTIQDITRQAELEREVIAISERERNRIGRDLHDGLGQSLTGISLGLKTLSQGLAGKRSPDVESVQDLTKMVQNTIAETRRVARLLSPGISSELGLGVALIALAEEVNEYPNVRCSAQCSDGGDIHDVKVATHLYRIAQECINNALKHSKAQNIELSYGRDGDLLFLEVLDDGIGIPLEQNRCEGMGLRTMRYRARMINGRLDVAPRTPGGTRVLCSCPLQSG